MSFFSMSPAVTAIALSPCFRGYMTQDVALFAWGLVSEQVTKSHLVAYLPVSLLAPLILLQVLWKANDKIKLYRQELYWEKGSWGIKGSKHEKRRGKPLHHTAVLIAVKKRWGEGGLCRKNLGLQHSSEKVSERAECSSPACFLLEQFPILQEQTSLSALLSQWLGAEGG